MKPLGASIRPALAGALLGLAVVAPPAAAQGDVRVAFPTIKDSRFRSGTNPPGGDLTLFPKVEGTGLEGAKSYRITVTGAKDDAGRSLLPESPGSPKWSERSDGMELWIRLNSPAREASAITLSGTLEVWIPSRDPASEVKVEKFYAKAGKPIVSPGLKDAKVEVTVLPRSRVNDGSVVLVGPMVSMERIRTIAVIRADGTEMDPSGSGSQSDGESMMLEVTHRELIPQDATLVLTLMTEKAVVVVPIEMSIPLP